MFKLVKFLKPYARETIFASSLKLFEAFLELMIPFYMTKIIDIGVANNDKDYIFLTALKMVGFATLGFLSVVTCHKMAARISCSVATDIREELMQKISTLSYNQIDKLATSSLVNRLTIDVNMVRDAVVFLIRLVTRAPFLCIGAVVMGFIVDKKTTIVFIIIIPLFSFFLFFITKKIVPFQIKMREVLDTLGMQLRENLSGIRVIRAFVRQDVEKKKVSKTINDLSSIYITLNNYKAIINPVTVLVLNLAIIVILYTSSFRIYEGTLTRSESMALIQYITQIMYALIIISNLVTLYTQAAASSKRIAEVLDMPFDITYNEGTFLQNENAKKALEFKGVSFAYVKDKYSVENINFSLKKGEVLGIIGPTGAGKTTLINLASRFYDVNKGEILYFDVNVKDYKKDKLLDTIGIVPQKSVLFSGTIAENMRYSKSDATDEEIIDALKYAQAFEFVKELNEGIGATVDRGGINFSGGQRQRLCIARALLKNPKLLILDDSLSALDYQTDMHIRRALKTYYKDTTVIIVSQRVSSVMNADNIIVMENGKIAEQGTHLRLMDKKGIYYQIQTTQSELEKDVMEDLKNE